MYWTSTIILNEYILKMLIQLLDSEIAPKLLRNCTEIALKLLWLWNCSENAPKLLWNCFDSEIALKVLRNCSETALTLKLLWKCSENALKLLWLWNCSENAPKLLLNCSETALKLLWTALIQYNIAIWTIIIININNIDVIVDYNRWYIV